MSGAAAAPQYPEGSVPSAEYAAQMTAASLPEPTITPANATPAPQAPAAKARPEYIPEKFWDAEKGEARMEDVFKSLGELEKKLGSRPADEPKPAAPTAKIEKPTEADGNQTPETPPANSGDQAASEANQAPDPAALTSAIEAAREAYAKDGQVTDELIQGLVKAGLPQDAVQMYFEGLKAYEASIVAAAHSAAGGAEQFEAMVGWARTNLSDADLDYYNGLVSSPENATRAVEWLASKYRGANPSEGNLVAAQPSVSGDTYTSQDAMLKDMQSAEYARDPAFRQKVAEKVQRSVAAGTLQSSAQFFG